MMAITTAEDDMENWLLEQGAISASIDSPEFAFATNSAATVWKRVCSYFS
jgi:hypothetical protein